MRAASLNPHAGGQAYVASCSKHPRDADEHSASDLSGNAGLEAIVGSARTTIFCGSKHPLPLAAPTAA
jgi:hypothetical protein